MVHTYIYRHIEHAASGWNRAKTKVDNEHVSNYIERRRVPVMTRLRTTE